MPKLPLLTAAEAERLLLGCGFFLLRTKGSHRIYQKGDTKIIIPDHSGKSLHPKIVKSVIDAVKQ
jgi:predicted RNA binding protein YcfA (HicA-like mRNA interferase family)